MTSGPATGSPAGGAGVVGGAAPAPRRARVAISAAYAAQGLGYAVVVTSLPTLKDRQGVDDTMVSLIVLLVCLAAAAGSVLADRIAVRRGSGAALAIGLVLQAAALPVIAAPLPLPVFVAAFAVYGLGLGAVDASAAMQGVIVQRRVGRAIMSGFFACYTAAAIVGALFSSATAGSQVGASIVLAGAAAVALAVALVGRRAFAAEREPAGGARRGRTERAVRPRLPASGILAFGVVILGAFVLDSAVSTWSTVYLRDTLLASAVLAPLGYAVYQACILLTRLAADRVVRRIGRAPVALGTALIAIVGCVVVAALPLPAAALVGFGLAGVGVGALVPLAFSGAGELDPRRGDEIIARVNLFNYGGAILGAVLPGLVGDAGLGLGPAFLLPALLLVPVLFLVRRFRSAPPEDRP